ncbi:anti-sigma factor antagonist [bacterium]|nr:anti-sigma factor antagonist [bacterium]
MAITSAMFEQDVVQGVTVLRFHKQRLYDSDKIEALQQLLLEFASDVTTPAVILNLRGVDYFSSAGIGALIRFAKRLAEKKVQLCLCELQPMVEEILLLQRLNLVFPIQPTEAAAFASLA